MSVKKNGPIQYLVDGHWVHWKNRGVELWDSSRHYRADTVHRAAGGEHNDDLRSGLEWWVKIMIDKLLSAGVELGSLVHAFGKLKARILEIVSFSYTRSFSEISYGMSGQFYLKSCCMCSWQDQSCYNGRWHHLKSSHHSPHRLYHSTTFCNSNLA